MEISSSVTESEIDTSSSVTAGDVINIEEMTLLMSDVVNVLQNGALQNTLDETITSFEVLYLN